jgi:hypothetical protein
MPAGSHTRRCTRRATGPLGDQREHDVPAVAVREPLAGREGGRVAAEHGQVLLGRREPMYGDGHRVVGDRVARVLVEVVTDAGSVRQQVLDRHIAADWREITAEHRAGRGGDVERPSSIRLTTVSAVRPLVPLAIANRVSTVFRIS